jgi:signal transduction histidine kinase
VSHDLRAPLRHMSGFTKILVEDFGPSLPADAQRYLQRIEQGAAQPHAYRAASPVLYALLGRG